MKKVICLLLCLVVLLSTAACDMGKPINEQYADIVKEYEEQYGVISKDRDIFYSSDALGGVSYIDLLDFNGDGVLELLLIFDQCTNENVMGGALTCHIYSEKENKASLVYTEELQKTRVNNNFLLNGRTLLLAKEEDRFYLVNVFREHTQLSEYPHRVYNPDISDYETNCDYEFLNYEFIKLVEGSFVIAEYKIGKYKSDSEQYPDLWMYNDEICSEEKYEDLKSMIELVECSTYFYEDLVKHNNSVKQSLGLPVTEIEESSEKSTTETATEEPTLIQTTENKTTEPATQEETTEIITTTEAAVKKDMSVDEMADAIAAHYTAQRTDGGGFNVNSSEASDKGDYYVFLVRYKCSPEEEAEMDRRFREEGIVPSANVLAFDVTVEKSTGKVVRSNDNDTWYLW